MKKFLFGLLLLSALFVRVSSVAASDSFVFKSVNNFTISDFTADYYLDKDSSGRSTLKTVENITAEFPQYDQNHGIERYIPMKYDDHSVNLKIESIKNEKGGNINYSLKKSNDNLVIRIGDSDKYVHNTMKYVITYTQRDVTRHFSDTDSDEFYWDINGTGWPQHFSSITARLHLGTGIAKSLNDKQSCYYGRFGDANQCELVRDDDVFTATVTKLKPYENVTIAVGFKSNTFSDYKVSLAELIEKYIVKIEIFIAILVFLILTLIRFTLGGDAPGRGTIVPEYLPPENEDIATAAVLRKCKKTWSTAIIIGLAVGRKIQISDNGDKKARKKIYTLKLLSIDKLSRGEFLVVQALFGYKLVIGSEYVIKPHKNDPVLAKWLFDSFNEIKMQVDLDGYYSENVKANKLMSIILYSTIAQMVLAAFVYQLNEDSMKFIAMTAIISFISGIIIKNSYKPLSEKGRKLSDYLKGLEMYIKTAETDRINFLQSPQGALKGSVDVNDSGAILQLYERVLPYAVLFGIEKKWTETLSQYYQGQNSNPYWYNTSDSFDSSSFRSAMSNFTSSVGNSSSYVSSSLLSELSSSGSSSSSWSSSGGSSGGGSSGGGGGGGGGGGW